VKLKKYEDKVKNMRVIADLHGRGDISRKIPLLFFLADLKNYRTGKLLLGYL